MRFVPLRAPGNASLAVFSERKKMECPACALDDPSQINHMEYGGCLWEEYIPKQSTCEGCNYDPPNGHPSQRYHMGPGGCLSNS